MHVTRITTTKALERLAPNWNCLAHGIPFRTWQWLFNWWKHYGDGKSLYTLAVYDDAGVLVGVAPWFIESRGSDGRVIQFLGSGHVCTDYLTILSTVEHASAVVTAIAQWLVRAAAGQGDPDDQWDLLDFECISVGETNIEAMLSALHVAGCSTNRRPSLNCWRLALPASWDVFASELPGSHAKKVRKVSRRVFGEGRGVLRTVREPAELELGMRIFVDLHQRRWTSQGEPGCFASSRFSDFMHDCVADLLAADMLNLTWLEIDGRPVATELLIATASTRYIYQGGIDPAAGQESPGHAIMIALFREAIEAGCQTIDFLRGDEPYKATWGAQPMATERIRVAPCRLGPQLWNQAWLAGQVMKDWVKQGLTLTGVR